MEEAVKQIIQLENEEYVEFMEYQKRRILELQEMLEKKNRGENVDVSEILSSLRRSGVLDDNNNISEMYAKAAVK